MLAGELLTVAPWAMKALPGLLTLNERVLLSGYWEHGFFSYTAVGALNVGSIKMDFDKVHLMQVMEGTLLLTSSPFTGVRVQSGGSLQALLCG